MHAKMTEKLKNWALIVLAAFVAVFVFGCVLQAFENRETMHMQSFGYAADHQQSGNHADDHMGIVMAFPSSSQNVLLAGILLTLLSAFVFLQRRMLFLEPSHVRWRQRSRKELFSEWNTITQLFRTGLLNPKIL